MSALLEVSGLGKRFGGLQAVRDVSFSLAPGEITGILGPNGAGKTTLFNLLTGFIAPDSGSVRLLGQEIVGAKPYAIVNMGLARTFQLARPFAGLTVLENVLVACLSKRARSLADRGARARQLLEQVGLAAKGDEPAELLPYGDLRRLELARALATGPTLLLLDEPFAGLGHQEIAPLSELILRLHRESGLAILMIEHKLAEFMQLVGRVIALDFGEVIADGQPGEIVSNERVIDAYIGRTEDAHGAA